VVLTVGVTIEYHAKCCVKAAKKKGLTPISKGGRQKFMLKFLNKLSYSTLILAAVFMLLTPISPMPHVVEKMIMIKNMTLYKPLDIFDLFFHLSPLILLIIKAIKDNR
jgi:hypothetical protein